MDLVTVTCKRDVNEIKRLAESVELFVSGLIHYVIVNEPIEEREFWEGLLRGYYKNNELVLMYESDFPYREDENIKYKQPYRYRVQQTYKLIMYEKLQRDYMVLDSKNLFIKKTDMSMFAGMIGCGRMGNVSSMGDQFLSVLDTYGEILGLSVPEYILDQTTPFVINKKVMETITDLRKTIDDFNSVNEVQSEFYFYSLLATSMGLTEKYKQPDYSIRTTVPFHAPSFEYKFEWLNHADDIFIIGVHKDYINERSKDELDIMNQHLEGWGIKTEFEFTNIE